MLKPKKHSHPDRTVINLSLTLIRRLIVTRIEGYDALRQYAKKMVVGGEVLFLPTLNFLFLLGVVEYRPKNDAIEYVGHNEDI